MHRLFGFPCGPRDVDVIHAETTSVYGLLEEKYRYGWKWFSRFEGSRNFLARDIIELSSKAKNACFKAACVIFIMGHLGTPSSKHE